jgi:predicted MFS family arabinose efflux permease
LALGAAGAAWGVGAALSNSVAGFIVDAAGFNAAFLFLAAVAALTFLLFWLAMPETGDLNSPIEDKTDASGTDAPWLGRFNAR